MILKLLISASILTLHLGFVAATGCHELQLSQLRSLNERMNQMMETISSLLPKSLKKLTSPVPPDPAPSVDHVPSTASPEISYHISPPTYSPPAYSPPAYSPSATMQPVMYVPPYAAVPTEIRLPRHLNPISTPITYSYYTHTNRAPQPELPLSPISAFHPQSPRPNYQYDHSPQYISPVSTCLTPGHPPSPYSLIQSPFPPEYPQPFPFGYPVAPSIPPNSIPACTLPLVPVPVQIPPGPYNMPNFPQVSEIPQTYK